MTALDLRPLSLGEILDRTFSLYRRHFLLFFGISAIPNVLVLALSLGQVALTSPAPARGGLSGSAVAWVLVTIVVAVVAYLFSQGGTILAVSELYLGRATSIAESLRRVWDDIGSLFGVILLNGIVVTVATILLIIPGFYMGCRLMVC